MTFMAWFTARFRVPNKKREITNCYLSQTVDKAVPQKALCGTAFLMV
jgi:hypothetical protein